MPLGSKFGPQNFFKKLWLRQSLDIMVSYHVQYDKKIMIQSSEKISNGQTNEEDANTYFVSKSYSSSKRSTDIRV